MRGNGWVALILFAAFARAQDVPLFEFHSGFWVNLHHFLYEQAMSDAESGSAAVGYYKREVVKLDLLSDEAAKINGRLAELENASTLDGSGLDPALIEALEAAAPAYRARWWPEHDRANRAWSQAASALVSKFGAALRQELATVWATPWPADSVRVDVSEYAGWAGAYTTLGPTHITISSSSAGNRGEAALEILFHEASHALIANVHNSLRAEARGQDKLFRRSDYWHAILFYSVGELVRRHLEDYTPYAQRNGLYARGWEDLPEILDKDWKPYINGEIDLGSAARRLVDAYGVDP